MVIVVLIRIAEFVQKTELNFHLNLNSRPSLLGNLVGINKEWTGIVCQLMSRQITVYLINFKLFILIYSSNYHFVFDFNSYLLIYHFIFVNS